MKLSELEKMISYGLDSTPSEISVILGCDCGCGGNYYTNEEWDKEHEDTLRARKKLKKFCKYNNIEIDIDKVKDV